MKKRAWVWVVVVLVVVISGGWYYKSTVDKPGSVTGKITSNPSYIFDHSAHHGGGSGF